MKTTVCTLAGVLGAGISAAFGEWDFALTALLIMMAVDYVSGLIVAGVFHTSNKSANGALESKAGWKGLCRKCVTLCLVLVAHWIDLSLGITYIRDMVVYGFMANELISIIENAGLMGVGMPAPMRKAIDILKDKAGEEDDHD